MSKYWNYGLKFDDKQGIILSKYVPTDYLLITKGKYRNFAVKKSGEDHLNQIITISFTNSKTKRCNALR